MSRLFRTFMSLWLATALLGVPLPAFSALQNSTESQHCMNMQDLQSEKGKAQSQDIQQAGNGCKHCQDRGCADKGCSGTGCQPCHGISFVTWITGADLFGETAPVTPVAADDLSSRSTPPPLRPPVPLHS